MSKYDYPDPGSDPAYCDGLGPLDESDGPTCFWCGEPLATPESDYCSAQCANYALTDDCER